MKTEGNVKTLIIRIFLLFPIYGVFAAGQTQNMESSIVNGTAEFLTDRANDNFLYIFETKLQGNDFLKDMFPNTCRMLKNARLQVLLTNKDIWDKSVRKDLLDIAGNSLNIINKDISVLPIEKMRYIEYLLTNIQGIEIQIGSDTFPINAQPLLKSDQIKQSYKSVYDKFENLQNAFAQLSKMSFQEIHVFVQNKDTLNATLDTLSLSLDSIGSIFHSKDYTILNADRFRKTIDSMQVLVRIVSELFKLVQIIADEKMGNTYRVLNSFDLLEYVAMKLPDSAFASSKLRDDYNNSFKRFKSYALFFAQLSEAKSKDEVKMILASATMPPVSFGTKREYSNHVFISSYWGLSAGIETIHHMFDLKKVNTGGYFGLTAPIGLEYSWGLGKSGSISAFASILDFGPVVNSQLSATNSDMRLKDVVSPGLYFMYGISEVPIAVSIGYFHAKSARSDSSPQHHITLNIVFDMPLMILY